MLQCVVMCCFVFHIRRLLVAEALVRLSQCVAVCCGVLQCIAGVAGVAVYGNIVPCVAMYCRVLLVVSFLLRHVYM